MEGNTPTRPQRTRTPVLTYSSEFGGSGGKKRRVSLPLGKPGRPSLRNKATPRKTPETEDSLRTSTLRRRSQKPLYNLDVMSSEEEETPRRRKVPKPVKSPEDPQPITLTLQRKAKRQYADDIVAREAETIPPRRKEQPKPVKGSEDPQPSTSTSRRNPKKKYIDDTTTASEVDATPPRRKEQPKAVATSSKDSQPRFATLPRRKEKKQYADDLVAKEAETTPSTPAGTRSSRRQTLTQIAEAVVGKTPPRKRPVIAASTPEPPKSKTLAKEKKKENVPVAKASAAPVTTSAAGIEWKFNVYGVPKCPLPCRETQFEEIWKFLFENVTEKNSGCMYVSGVPGTGKTVIVQAVVDTMQKLTKDKKKDIKFKNLYINGLTLASPDKIWKRMFKGLELVSKGKGKGISTKEALKRLNSHFEGHHRDPVILVVDELDQILDKQQSILYQLLEWSSHARNMFSFVAIFNTMSLPEHGLAMRNYSRIGFKRAVFPPYSYDQLQTIVSNMLSTFTTVRLNSESISLLSRKVAAISGDARRALEIARRAMEIAESGNLSGIQAVSHAFKEIFSSAKIETIKYTSLLEQLILRTISDEIRCSGVEEVLVAKIYENVLPKAAFEGMSWPKDEILKAMMRLAVMKLLIVEDNSTSIHKRVLLKVPVEDVNFALGIHTDLA